FSIRSPAASSAIRPLGDTRFDQEAIRMAVSQPATGSTVMARLCLQLLKGTEHPSFRLAAGGRPKPEFFLGGGGFPIDRSDSVPALPTAIDCGRGHCVDAYLGCVLANWQSKRK